jgi:hypothetical protein
MSSQEHTKETIRKYLADLFENSAQRILKLDISLRQDETEQERRHIEKECAKCFCLTLPEDFVYSSEMLNNYIWFKQYGSVNKFDVDRIYKLVMTDVSLAIARNSWCGDWFVVEVPNG